MKSVMRILGVAGLTILAAAAMVTPAAAAEFGWGNAVATVGDNIKPTLEAALTGVIMIVLVKYAGPFGMLIRQQFVSDLIEKAVGYAFAATFGAVRGKTLTVDDTHKVLGQVVKYAESNFPWVLRVLIGGATKLIEKSIARMPEIAAEFQHGAERAPVVSSAS